MFLFGRLSEKMPHAVPVYKRPSNKDRLYIALYARGGDSVMSGGEDKYVRQLNEK